jgi:uncharacterized protein YuzB (UPF0349 family)
MFSRCGGCFSDAVAIFSGEVINGENEQILRFFFSFVEEMEKSLFMVMIF